MKNLARCLVFAILFGFLSNAYSQEWIPYQQTVQTSYSVQQTYIYQPQPIVVYRWVPQIIQENFVIERRCLFHTTQTVVAKPTVQWILQPVVIYR